MFFPTIHSASLVDASLHPPALLELVNVKLDRTIIEYLIDSVVETVDYAFRRAHGQSVHYNSKTSSFPACVHNVIERAEVKMPVVLASLVYLQRVKPDLWVPNEEWGFERLFLGALIIASKYLNDSSLNNAHWAVCTGVFGNRDIGRIELEFLNVLDFKLGISEEDILSLHEPIMAIISRPTQHNHPQSLHKIVETPTSDIGNDLNSSPHAQTPQRNLLPAPQLPSRIPIHESRKATRSSRPSHTRGRSRTGSHQTKPRTICRCRLPLTSSSGMGDMSASLPSIKRSEHDATIPGPAIV